MNSSCFYIICRSDQYAINIYISNILQYMLSAGKGGRHSPAQSNMLSLASHLHLLQYDHQHSHLHLVHLYLVHRAANDNDDWIMFVIHDVRTLLINVLHKC